jgi:Ca-activated chloride channel family protein
MKKILFLIPLIFAFGCQEDDANNSLGNWSVESFGERYNDFEENPFVNVTDAPVSTFSIDADGASYANVRRFLSGNRLPPKAAVRTEELINYFSLDFPESSATISLNGEVSECPWNVNHKLVRIGIKGKSVSRGELPASNFVFLIDVSGSMASPDKLELLKQGFTLLVNELDHRDKVAIVTYAGSAGVVLASTTGDNKNKIREAINSLGSGGSTAGAQGIITAYDIAAENFIQGGNNRVVLGTDGDFNVGVASQEELVALIEDKRDTGIFLNVLGVGTGNLNEGTLEQIADNGNGTYEYIDNLEQAKKVFVYEYNKFYTAAKDVKTQVVFNPELVESYRLIGYENRMLENDDFKDDQKDAGEIAIGQNITVLYEIKPKVNAAFKLSPTFTIHFRYKEPSSDTSIPMDIEITDEGTSFAQASEHMRFTASVAGFGMMLRDSPYKGNLTFDHLLTWTDNTLSYDPHDLRKEFRILIDKAKGL